MVAESPRTTISVLDREEPPAGSLAAERTPDGEDRVVSIPVDRLEPDPFQPRTTIAEAAVQELARSISLHGVLQPLLVRPMQGPNSRGRYWIVAGERRWRAAQILGLPTLPCRIRDYENMAAAVIALAENVHREDLSELDKAAALLRIRTLTDRTWEDVAELVKLSRDYVKRLAGLLKLEESVQELVRSGQISVRTAIALRPLPPKKQVEMAARILNEGLTAEGVREAVRLQKERRSGRGPEEEEPPLASAMAAARARGTVAGTLRAFTDALQEIDTWIEGREWSPSRVSDSQREELESLHAYIIGLDQRLAALRGMLQDPPRRPAREITDLEAGF